MVVKASKICHYSCQQHHKALQEKGKKAQVPTHGLHMVQSRPALLGWCREHKSAQWGQMFVDMSFSLLTNIPASTPAWNRMTKPSTAAPLRNLLTCPRTVPLDCKGMLYVLLNPVPVIASTRGSVISLAVSEQMLEEAAHSAKLHPPQSVNL